MCNVLGVSRSGYYAFLRRGRSVRDITNEKLLGEIRRVHQESHGVYGSPRVHRELARRGIRCGLHRVARLMARDRIRARAHRRFRTTTKARAGALVAPDLLQRQFVAERPHQVWTSDITYIWTMEGWLYLAVVLDLFSRLVVGWATGVRIDATLVCGAFVRAFARYRPGDELISHSDRGSQYTSQTFRQMLQQQSIVVHMNHGISCYDNAVTESFFHTLKTEWVPFQGNQTRAEVHAGLFQYLEIFYNNQRLHSSLGYRTPAEKLQDSITKTA
jgi:putative transposase